jgi:hypothetical protein
VLGKKKRLASVPSAPISVVVVVVVDVFLLRRSNLRAT